MPINSPFDLPPDANILWQKLCKYEEAYFLDMMLKKWKKRISRECIIDSMTGKEKVIYDSGFDDFYYKLSIASSNWNIEIIPDEKVDFYGVCDSESRTIIITESHKNNKLTLLHELIHYYETVLKEYMSGSYREIVLINLYDKLSR